VCASVRGDGRPERLPRRSVAAERLVDSALRPWTPPAVTTPRSPLRRVILAAADSATLRRLAEQHGFRLGAARFVAGESLETALPALARLDARGLLTNTTILGEGVADAAETRQVVDGYRVLLERLRREGLRTNVALKLTQLGLAFDEELAYRNVSELVAAAAEHGSFIRIDMEESQHVEATLRTYRRLSEAGQANVGTVLQAYLYRSEDDLEALLPLRPNLRFVKGAYLEPPELAYPSKSDVDAAFLRLVERSLLAGGFTAIATHDERLIDAAISFARAQGIGPERYQFQMLYGVRPALQLDLLLRGEQVLVATPYGPQWYRYLLRRLAERPANLVFFARNALRR
jgi:proline dehydrogenase